MRVTIVWTTLMEAFFCKFQTEIENGLKDVAEQREQLYRKLEVLRAQGIELGPNLSVLKNEPPVMAGKGSPGEAIFYKEVTANTPTSGSSPINLSAPSSSSIRKSSSLTSSSSAILTPSNNVLTGKSSSLDLDLSTAQWSEGVTKSCWSLD